MKSQRGAASLQVPRAPLYPNVLAMATVLLIEPALRARYLSISHWLRDFYTWPPSHRQDWQQAQLETVVRHAARHVPFYRETLGEVRADSVTLDQLPVMNKAKIRSDMDSFLMPGWEQQPHRNKRTGGTTGDPWRYPLDNRAWQNIYAAALHFRERVGYRYGERVVLLGTPPSLLGEANWKARLRRSLEQQIPTAAGIELDHSSSLERARRAEELKGVLWYGHAGTVAAMADAVTAEGLAIRPPRAIITTAETLQPAWRARIESTFGAPLFDEYGCNDGGVLAQMCGAGRYHVADNVSIVEVLDGGRSCPPGVEGDVTVTNLHALILPFLRYQTGDRAVAATGPCPCGVQGGTLARIAGRQGDRVVLPDGTELSAISFGHAFKEDTPNVRRWQVVQVTPTELKVRVDVTPAFDAEEAERIRTFLASRCGERMAITVTSSEPIEMTPGGKHKIVVRQFDSGAG